VLVVAFNKPVCPAVIVVERLVASTSVGACSPLRHWSDGCRSLAIVQRLRHQSPLSGQRAPRGLFDLTWEHNVHELERSNHSTREQVAEPDIEPEGISAFRQTSLRTPHQHDDQDPKPQTAKEQLANQCWLIESVLWMVVAMSGIHPEILKSKFLRGLLACLIRVSLTHSQVK
jgi:hypothetical protein